MSILSSVEQLHAGLDYHMARHNVLVSNLAQAETPNYKPVDLARSGFEEQLRMMTTADGHLASAGASSYGTLVTSPVGRVGTDGNGVDIDREAVKIATNQIRFSVLSQLASSELASLEWAVSDGRGA